MGINREQQKLKKKYRDGVSGREVVRVGPVEDNALTQPPVITTF